MTGALSSVYLHALIRHASRGTALPASQYLNAATGDRCAGRPLASCAAARDRLHSCNLVPGSHYSHRSCGDGMQAIASTSSLTRRCCRMPRCLWHRASCVPGTGLPLEAEVHCCASDHCDQGCALRDASDHVGICCSRLNAVLFVFAVWFWSGSLRFLPSVQRRVQHDVDTLGRTASSRRIGQR